jgi:hypothetical protein
VLTFPFAGTSVGVLNFPVDAPEIWHRVTFEQL